MVLVAKSDKSNSTVAVVTLLRFLTPSGSIISMTNVLVSGLNLLKSNSPKLTSDKLFSISAVAPTSSVSGVIFILLLSKSKLDGWFLYLNVIGNSFLLNTVNVTSTLSVDMVMRSSSIKLPSLSYKLILVENVFVSCKDSFTSYSTTAFATLFSTVSGPDSFTEEVDNSGAEI